MPKPRSFLFWLRWVVLLIGIVWYWEAPHWAWGRFLNAVDTASVEGLNETIDMAAFRQNLRIDLSAAVMNTPGTADEKTRVETVRGMLGNLVDAAASPGGIQQTVGSFGYTGPDVMSTDKAPDISFHFRSLLGVDVLVHAKGSPESETGVFSFRLTGAGWRLTRIRSLWLEGKQA